MEERGGLAERIEKYHLVTRCTNALNMSSAKNKREYLEGIVAMAMLQYCEKVQRVRAQRERESTARVRIY